MSESVVRGLFPRFAVELGEFRPDWLVDNTEVARSYAIRIFNHERKIDAILKIASVVHSLGADGLDRCMLKPEMFLPELPYIGPVTWKHLAKNLGVSIAKSDRHLVRLAEALGRSSVDDLCNEVSAWIGDPVPVVDIVLWRWATLHKNEISLGSQRLSRQTFPTAWYSPVCAAGACSQRSHGSADTQD